MHPGSLPRVQTIRPCQTRPPRMIWPGLPLGDRLPGRRCRKARLRKVPGRRCRNVRRRKARRPGLPVRRSLRPRTLRACSTRSEPEARRSGPPARPQPMGWQTGCCSTTLLRLRRKHQKASGEGLLDCRRRDAWRRKARRPGQEANRTQVLSHCSPFTRRSENRSSPFSVWFET